MRDTEPPRPSPPPDVLRTARSIAEAQLPCGAIPWPDGHVDPWDHVECAMALSACGLAVPARVGLKWVRDNARPGGLVAKDDRRPGGGERGRGGRPGGREPPRRLRRGRHLARVPGHRRP